MLYYRSIQLGGENGFLQRSKMHLLKPVDRSAAAYMIKLPCRLMLTADIPTPAPVGQ